MTQVDAWRNWRGIYPSICTPFTASDEVDVEAARSVVRFALDAGAQGIVGFGLAGEVLKLSFGERLELAEAVLDEVGGRVPVMLGVGAESLSASRALARHASAAGADAIVMSAPVSATPGDEGLVDYFVRLAAEAAIPVMIQDAPAYLGIGLGPALVRRIAAQAPNVRMVKLEAGPAEMARWLDELGGELSVWGGDGGLYQLDCLRIGAAGIVPGVDLVDFLVAIYEAEAAGESEVGDELFRRILPMLVFEMQSMDHYNACAKHVLVKRGVLLSSGLRPPAQPFADSSARLLTKHLAALDLDDVGTRAHA